MLSGSISVSAILMIGQVVPQIRHNTTNITRAPVSAGAFTGSGLLACDSRLLRSGAKVPVEDLLACPEQYVLSLADVLDRLAEIFHAVRRAHDVGMDRERHHARRICGVSVNLFELIDRAV